MKKGLLILVLALAAGAAAFVATRSHRQSEQTEILLDTMPELEWLRTQLKLSEAQSRQAGELHTAYRPICGEMCRNITEAHAKLETLAQTERGMTPELTAAIQHHARVHAECQAKMLEHLYQTAAVLDDKQAARYLETMIPHALDSSITGGKPGCHKD